MSTLSKLYVKWEDVEPYVSRYLSGQFFFPGGGTFNTGRGSNFSDVMIEGGGIPCLSELSGIGVGTVSNITRGKQEYIGLDMAEKLLMALDEPGPITQIDWYSYSFKNRGYYKVAGD